MSTAQTSAATPAPDLAARVRAAIRDVPDFPKPGILFKDITTVLADGPLYAEVCRWFADLAKRSGATYLAGIESRGFLFAAPAAAELGLPLALVRKPGKLPYRTRKCSYSLEYGTDSIEMHEDSFPAGARVLLADDLLATGGTMSAACSLVRDLGAEVVQVAFVVDLSFLNGRARLPAGVPVEALVGY
jgi:adenine phosphoribosyltransferase